MKALTVTARTEGAWAVVELAGELDFHTAPQVRAVVETQELGPGRGLVVDLGGLTFCDSSGITAMIVARGIAQGATASIVLAALPDRVARIFALVGLDQVFVIHPSSADAVATTEPLSSVPVTRDCAAFGGQAGS